MSTMNFTPGMEDESPSNYFINDSFTNEPTPLPSWAKHMDNLQLSLTIIGSIANLVSLITLIKNGKSFQVSSF